MLLLRCQQRSRLHPLDRAASYGWLKTQSIRSIPQGAKMAEAPRDSGRVALRWWRRWAGWIGYVAVAWSLVYGILGLYWSLGGAAFPFGENDAGAALSILGGVRVETGAPVISALGLAGAVAVVMARTRQGRGVLRAVLLGFAWVAAATLTLVIPDYRALVAVSYTPIVVIGAPFGWPPGVSILDVFPWPVVNQFICIGGGLLWAATAAAYGRRSRGACERCGRDDAGAGWTRPDVAARWGRWATYVAVVVPVLYAVRRLSFRPSTSSGLRMVRWLRSGTTATIWG
jgi:hypothetical protein